MEQQLEQQLEAAAEAAVGCFCPRAEASDGILACWLDMSAVAAGIESQNTSWLKQNGYVDISLFKKKVLHLKASVDMFPTKKLIMT